MNLLAVNSSDDRVSVAANVDGCIFGQQRICAREHNRFILTMVQDVLSKARLAMREVDAIVYGVGPGSFTGLRISAGVAQGIAFGIDVPVIAVSCMAAIAQKQDSKKAVVAIDAKQNQVHWGCYIKNKNGLSELQGQEHLTEINQLIVDGENWHGAGSAWDMHAETLIGLNPLSVVGWTEKQSADARELALLGAAKFLDGQVRQAVYAIPKYSFPYLTG